MGIFFQEIRKSADSGTHMMAKRFHLQGYEYKAGLKEDKVFGSGGEI